MKKDQESDELPENDHRDLGRRLDLFSFHEVAPGAPFWHHKGLLIFRELETYARRLNDSSGYHEISTPILVKKELFEQSGHWKHYRDNMFWFKNPNDKNETLVIKPMNCPESTFVYNSSVRSYKDLPLRFAEMGRLHRNERSGTIGGLFRVRQITMDDAHIYVRPDQVKDEIRAVISIIEHFYGFLGFKPRYVFATRPQKALGTKKDWDMAEEALSEAMKIEKIPYEVAGGEGAFYGPKIEIHMKDSQGRDWQLGTAQLDLVMLPKQFELFYIDGEGKKQMPWVIHRAIFGSFERFIGILLEHFSGALPLWLSPIQVELLTVNDRTVDYAREVAVALKNREIRAHLDERNESIGKKIREAELQKIPILGIIGTREAEEKTVSVRERGKGDLGPMALAKFIELVYTRKVV